jgi:predicted dehydrogenase
LETIAVSDFASAADTITQALANGRIGTPVAARVVAQPGVQGPEQEHLTAQILETVGHWLANELQDLTAFGGGKCPQISALARYGQGQSALVSVGGSNADEHMLSHIVVWGSRGVLSWQTNDGASANDKGQPPLSSQAAELCTQLRTSLGATVPAGEVAHTSTSSTPIVPTAPPWGVLLVAGDHTHQPGYAEALAGDARCHLIGLTDEADLPERRQRLNAQMADRLGIPLLADLDAALQRPDVQIVSICAEPARRGPIIVKAAQAGKHLYLDKPLAGSLEHSRQITAAVRRAGVVSHMWSMLRSESFDRTYQALHSGGSGNLAAIHFDLCFAKGHAGTAQLGVPRQEAATPARYELLEAKREMANVAVYSLASLFALSGATVRRVCASTGNYFFSEHQAADMEDFGQIMLELDDGTIATFSAGRTGWYSHPSSGMNRTVLVGAQGATIIDAHQPRVELWADGEPWHAPPADPQDPMAMWASPTESRFIAPPKQAWQLPSATDMAARDVAYFLDCIEQGRPSDICIDQAAAASEVLFAAYRSAASGKVVTLPLDEFLLSPR